MTSRFIEEEDTNKVNDRIAHLLNTYYSDEENENEEPTTSTVDDSQRQQQQLFEQQRLLQQQMQDLQERMKTQVRQRQIQEEHIRKSVPEFDLTKIVGAFTSMMKPKDKPKPKVQNYITKVYEIVVGYLLAILHFILPEDMVVPAENLIKGRLSTMVQEEILELKEEHEYFYRFVLGLCCILYYAYQSRILLAFINGVLWGAYLF